MVSLDGAIGFDLLHLKVLGNGGLSNWHYLVTDLRWLKGIFFLNDSILLLLLLSKLVYVNEPFVDSVATLNHGADKMHITVAKVTQIGVLTRSFHVC